MPIYIFKHPETDEIFEVFRFISKSDEPFVAPDGVKCEKQLTTPGDIIVSEGRNRAEEKERDYRKKVKCPERAMRNRKKMFGTEGVSITKSPYYKKEKRIKAQGTSQEIDKQQFVKMAAKNPNAVAAARKITGK